MKLMVASFVQQEEKRRFGIGAKTRRPKAKANAEGTNMNVNVNDSTATNRRTPPGGASEARAAEPEMSAGSALGHRKHGRYLSLNVRREVHDRDRGRCAFVSADGRRCTARVFLQFDHVRPFARCGGDDAPNIRLLCQSHNLLHARRCFGKRHMAAKIAAKSFKTREKRAKGEPSRQRREETCDA